MVYKCILSAILFAMLSFLGGWYVGVNQRKIPFGEDVVVCDTITKIVVDTTRVVHIEHITETILRNDTLKKIVEVSVNDTVMVPVYVDVEVPITQRYYKDSLFEAWVSGHKPALDSINVFNRTVYRDVTIYQKKKWGLGAQAGVTYTGKVVSPYIGIGLSYNLFQW